MTRIKWIFTDKNLTLKYFNGLDNLSQVIRQLPENFYEIKYFVARAARSRMIATKLVALREH
ncbi:MAG: hypothetical protein HQ534_03425 [Armatimonadetes bacterium]|nr:hypothetical protein [Armatimonadota bacterium]